MNRSSAWKIYWMDSNQDLHKPLSSWKLYCNPCRKARHEVEGGRQRAKAEGDVASLWYFALILLNDLIFDFDNENLSS